MMSCTRIYLESTETMMGQGRNKRLLSLPKELFENMLGQNSLFGITKTMETNLSLMGQRFGPYGHFSALLKGFSSLSPMG